VSERWLAVLATAIGILYLVVTPPYQVPDEWNHYVRSEAIAEGHVVPDMTWQGDCASFPDGVERFVRAMYRTEGTFTLREMREAAAIRRDTGGISTLCFSSWYTPLPYAPQVIVAAISRALVIRPFVTFYAGRLFNLGFAILLLLAAMRAAPEHRDVIAAVVLLPMAMFQLASWSADVPTFAAAVLLTALLLRAARSQEMVTTREALILAAMALVVALCKPVYFLIALLVFAVPRRRFRSRSQRVAVLSGVLLAVAIGVATAAATAGQARYNARINLPIDARQQARCVASNPIRFAHVALDDLRVNGTAYVEEMTGRLGMMNVKLPSPITWIEVLLLVVIGVACTPPVSAFQRLLAMFITVATIGGVLLSQYLIWSVICGHAIEGVQGRYFLPILPLAAASLGAGLNISESAKRIAIVVVAIVANVVALTVLLQRYWS
jgi:uncharacterized membrane protein